MRKSLDLDDAIEVLAEHDLAETARHILREAEEVACTIHLPQDIVVAREFAAGAAHEVLPAAMCPEDAMILDAGPKTVEALTALFEKAATVVWNGPLGAFEIEPFDRATMAAARIRRATSMCCSTSLCRRLAMRSGSA